MSSIIPCFDKVKETVCFGGDYVCTYTYIHAYSHKRTRTCAIHTCMHIFVHTYTYMHNVHMYTCIHMCTIQVPHTYMYTTNISYIQEKRRILGNPVNRWIVIIIFLLSYTHDHFLPYTIKSRRQH